jgi:putative toxin-antitoxin system antitoxin component (TIGR02293 family)
MKTASKKKAVKTVKTPKARSAAPAKRSKALKPAKPLKNTDEALKPLKPSKPPLRLNPLPNKKAGSPPPGLDFGEFEALRRQLDVSLDELSIRLGLSRATIEKRKATGRLSADESGKVVCFARLLGHAVHLFGGLEEARRWLKAPQRILHGAVPLDYAKTDLGAAEVENLLTELDYGIKA